MEPKAGLEIEMASALETTDPSRLGNALCGVVCTFCQQEDELELETRSRSTRKLTGLVIFCSLAIVMEVVGGIKSNSLAVLTDAAHLFSDVAGFVISLFAVRASGWKPTSRHTFGFYRLEVLAALLSILLIWLITAILMYEAVDRLLQKSNAINGRVMFSVAAFGFLVNLVMILWLGHNHSHHDCRGKDHHHSHHHHLAEELAEETAKFVSQTHAKTTKMNINLEGAYLHIVSDLIQSVGVMITGAIIWAKPNWLVADLICTTVFSVVSLAGTLSTLTNILDMLMETTPKEIDIVGVENDLRSVEGVLEVNDLHVWSITYGKVAMSCHVIMQVGVDCKQTLHAIRHFCQKRYQINHVTVQIEQE